MSYDLPSSEGSRIPSYAAPTMTFAARAKAKKAQIEAQRTMAPPPGFSGPPPGLSAPNTGRGRSRVPSPSFYGVHDGRERRHGQTKPLLPITPSLAPTSQVVTPPAPSPIPRTPTPPPSLPSIYKQPASSASSSKSTINDVSTYSMAPPSTAPSTAATKEKRQRNVIRKKASSNPANGSQAALRTGSTTSAPTSTNSYMTTSSSASGRNEYHMPSILGISMPVPSYSSRTSNIPPPGSFMQRSRSGSGSGSQPDRNSGTTSLPRLSTSNLPVMPAASEQYGSASSPSSSHGMSPGMFSYSSTPTSSSTNPSSSLQSPGFRPNFMRSASDKSDYGGSKSEPGDRRKLRDDKSYANTILASVRESSLSTSSGSTVRETKDRLAETRPSIPVPSKHVRKSSKETNVPKTGFGGFHFRKSSKDISKDSTPVSTPSETRKNSQDSTKVQSPESNSTNTDSYFPSITSAPIPIPSSRPVRPSREKVPDLHPAGLETERPVIQSGLAKDSRSKGKISVITSSSLPQRRGASFGNAVGSSFQPASVPDRGRTRVPTPTSARGASVIRGFDKPTTASAKKEERRPSLDKDKTPTQTTRPSIFGSRGRTKSVPAPVEKVERMPTVLQKRAGPAAGTGYEGYSQYSKTTRTRSSSGSAIPTAPKITSTTTTPTGSWGRTAGAAATKKLDMDGFLLDHLKPVVIAGGGNIIENQNVDMARSSSSQSNQSLLPRKKPESQKSSIEMSRSGSNQDSKPSSLEIPPARPATRKPLVDPKVAKETSPKLEYSPLEEDYWPDGQEGSWLKPPKKLPPPVPSNPSPPPRRWNIFQRSQSVPDVGKDITAKSVIPLPKPRHSPHLSEDIKYFGNDNAGGYIKDVHSPPPVVSPTQPKRQSMSKNYTNNMRKLQHVHDSVLLPDPPAIPASMVSRTPSPVTTTRLPVPVTIGTRTPSPVTRPPPGLPFPSRAEVFPSPEAITLDTLVPSQPVSPLHTVLRPPPGLPMPSVANFPPGLVPTMFLPGLSYMKSMEDIANEEVEQAMKKEKQGLLEPIQLAPLPAPVTPPMPQGESPAVTPPRQRLQAVGRIPMLKTRGETNGADSGPAMKLPTLAEILPPPPELPSRNQLIKIHPPRRMAHPQQAAKIEEIMDNNDDSSSRTSLDSDGRTELAPLITADWPLRKESIPTRNSMSDEWDEYDDFLDQMDGTRQSAISTTSSLGHPFPYANLKLKPDVESEVFNSRKKDSPTLPFASTFQPVMQFPPNKNLKKLVLDKGKLALGRPVAARPLFSPALPTTTMSLFSPRGISMTSTSSSSSYASHGQKTIAFADFIAAYAEHAEQERIMSIVDPLQGTRTSAIDKLGLLSPHSVHTDFEDESDNESARQSIISAMPGTEDAVEGEMKVRLWALMTQKWLSFGRVLVSPAHEEMRAGGGGNRILIIDGLGNDDWSFYCSLNYVDATVYNLTASQAPSPMSPGGEQIPVDRGSSSPPNHHQIHHASFASPFPFPSGFFSVVSFRFLPPNADALWPFIISQCMRVLRPGGHIELSVLDIDMVNMGQRTKRTVDDIKRTLHSQAGNAADWNKRNPSDKALRLMAKRGFTDITRCWVGLPAVGNVDGSREERASMQQILREASASDEVDMSSAEGMNRVVSKVGRWWYAKCFEENPDDDEQPVMHFKRSLWEDKILLRECEKKRTNFRMLITFAKKPLDWKE